MNLYLVQHGEAVAKAIDPERPLTEAGAGDVHRLAAFLAKAGVRVARVLNSGKKRARQTADILTEALAPGVVVEDVVSGLAPKDSTEWLTKAAKRSSEDTLVVGHQPFMGRMVAQLVTGSERVRTSSRSAQARSCACGRTPRMAPGRSAG